eukprot:scaffold328_cov130-Cylindrotheca_fusiformis.AAC.6
MRRMDLAHDGGKLIVRLPHHEEESKTTLYHEGQLVVASGILKKEQRRTFLEATGPFTSSFARLRRQEARSIELQFHMFWLTSFILVLRLLQRTLDEIYENRIDQKGPQEEPQAAI